jgi:hypothetical protein
MLNDQQAWDQALTAADEMYDRLPAGTRAELDGLIDEVMRFKQELVELVTCAGSSTVCRTCEGQCCLLGKYHVSILDLLAYRKTKAEPVVPSFAAGQVCPYSGNSGCRMPADYRPVTCVIFNCQAIEDLLTPTDRQTLQEREKRLRETVSRASALCNTRLDRPLLLSCS